MKRKFGEFLTIFGGFVLQNQDKCKKIRQERSSCQKQELFKKYNQRLWGERLLQQKNIVFPTEGYHFFRPEGNLYFADMCLFQKQEANPGLPDAAANG